MKRRALAFLGLLAIAAGIIYYYMNQRETEIVLTGIVTTDDVIVSAQVAGRIDKLLVKQGDTVKKGDLLAIVQPDQWQADMAFYESSRRQAATQVSQAQAELRWQEQQSQNQIAQAEANLSASQAEIKQAEAELENLRLTFSRTEDLFKKRVESQQAFDQARTSYDAGKARLTAARENARSAEAALALSKTTQEQIALRRAQVAASEHHLQAAGAQTQKAGVLLAYTDVRAPIDGIVDVRAALAGEVVNPGQAIVTLVNPDDLWVRADVEETYIDRIKLGDRMTVRLPSGNTREGTVFYRAVDATFATQRDVSRTKRDIKTFEIRLRCDNADRSLAIGMTAYVSLPLDTTTRSAANR